MTSEGSRDWRGGRSPRRSQKKLEEQAVPVWKSGRHHAAGTGKGFARSGRRIIVPIALLALLVGIAIALWAPWRRLHTQFITFDLLAESAHFDAAAPPVFPGDFMSVFSRRQVSSVSLASLGSFAAEGSGAAGGAATGQAQTSQAHVVVMYLQTVVLPGPGGRHLCLVRNSTPDVDEAGYEDLATLRSRLIEFRKAYPTTQLLLLFDAPPLNSAWRVGYLYSHALSQLATWVQQDELQGLVVIASAGDGEQSAVAMSGTEGRTVFGHFASTGFSQLADRDGNTELTVAEYADYVASRTAQWVTENRDVRGQQVRILPPLEEIRKAEGRHNFVLMKDVPAGTDAIAASADASLLEPFGKLWLLRDSLHQRHGYGWDPVTWQVATQQLRRAETALLDGRFAVARKLLSDAEESFRQNAAETDRNCRDLRQLNAEQGLARSWVDDLPAFSRLSDLWQGAPEEENSRPPFRSPEDVLSRQLGSGTGGFPFAQAGLTPPAGTALQSVLDRRAAAETAAAHLFSVADLLPQTALRSERQVLLSEDRLFVTPDSQNVAPTAPDGDLLSALQNFGIAARTAETTARRVLEAAPSLARWAAEAELPLSSTLRSRWVSLLKQTTADTALDRVTTEQLLKQISDEDGSTGTGIPALTAGLRTAVLRLLTRTRSLQQALQVIEPASGFDAQQLTDQTSRLTESQKATDDALRLVVGQLHDLSQAMALNKPQIRSDQVTRYRLIRSLFSVSLLTAEHRRALLDQIVELDQSPSVVAPAARSAASDGSSTAAASASSPASGPVAQADFEQQSLWMLQMLHLLPRFAATKESAVQVAEAVAAAGSRDGQLVPPDHEATAAFGLAVRDHWRKTRDNIRAALRADGDDTAVRLRAADTQCRLLAEFDARETGISPSRRLLQCHRFACCLLHVARLLEGQWIDTDDREPWLTSGWYARAVRVWLDAAAQTAEQLRTGSLPVPQFARSAIDQATEQLNRSDGIRAVVDVPTDPVDLGQASDPRKTIRTQVRFEAAESRQGVASLRLVPLRENAAAALIRTENNPQSVVLPTSAPEARFDIVRTGNPGSSDTCRPADFHAVMFFRGRTWNSLGTVSISPCAVPEYLVRRIQRPRTASIQLTGTDLRPIVLVLDWSQSMKSRLPGQAETTRAQAAIETLEDLLRNPLLDESTKASLIVFGHRANWDGEQHLYNDAYREAFRPKGIPEKLSALEDIETEFPLRSLNAEGKQAFGDTLRKLVKSGAWGITPLATAITRAITDDLNNKAGIVIAVTDGEANDVGVVPPRAARNPQELRQRQVENDDRRKRLENAMKANPDTRVVIVAFDFAARAGELRSLKDVFEQIRGIQVIDAADKAQLLQQILGSLDPRHYTVERQTQNFSETATLGETIRNLPPGDDYTVKFASVSSESSGPLSLAAGDELRLALDWKDNRFVYPRNGHTRMKATAAGGTDDSTPFILRAGSEAAFRTLPPAADGVPGSAVTLSLMLDHERTDLPVRQPAEIEFHVRPRNDAFRPRLLTEEFTPALGAPGWNIQLDRWPAEDHILVDAFWKMSATEPDELLAGDVLLRSDSPATARRVGGAGKLLPEIHVWSSLMPDGTAQVRIDPVAGVPYDPENLPEQVRVQIGPINVRQTNLAFVPEDVTTTIRTLETGSVIYEFAGEFTQEVLSSRQFALTSAKARQSGAIRLQQPLLINERRNTD